MNPFQPRASEMPGRAPQRGELARRSELLADWIDALVHGQAITVLPVAPQDARLLETVRALFRALQPVEPRAHFVAALERDLLTSASMARLQAAGEPFPGGQLKRLSSSPLWESCLRAVRAVAAAAPVWELPPVVRAGIERGPHAGFELAPEARRRVTVMLLGSMLTLAGAWLILSRPRARASDLRRRRQPPAMPPWLSTHGPAWPARIGGQT
jgi:hypothetical protein